MSEYFEYQGVHKSSTSRAALQSLSSSSVQQESPEKSLEQLKMKIGSSLDYALKDKSCLNDDNFLYSFLYAKKLNSIDAYNLLIQYFNYKYKYKDQQQNQQLLLLNNLNIFDNSIQLALKDGFPHILNDRDRKGHKIIVFLASNWNYDNYTLEVIYRSLLLTLDKLLDNKHNQANGFVIVIDWNNFTLKQSSCLNPKILNCIIEGLQDSYPAKFKAIHFLGQPWHVEVILNLSKLTLTSKSRERIIYHGKNLSTLHDYIPKDVLPSELGGEGASLNPLDWYHKLLESSQLNQSDKTYKLTDNIVYTKLSNS